MSEKRNNRYYANRRRRDKYSSGSDSSSSSDTGNVMGDRTSSETDSIQGKRDSYRTNRNRQVEYRRQSVAIPDLPTPECPACKQPITDLASAINDPVSGQAMHFDCVIKKIEASETLGQNEKVIYIGQGRFAVAYYENPADQKTFKLQRIIQFEDRENRAEWRNKIAGFFSKV